MRNYLLAPLLVAALAPAVAHAQWTDGAGGDHAGWDYTPAAGTTIGGSHVGVDALTLRQGGTFASLASGAGASVQAARVVIDGNLDGAGPGITLDALGGGAGHVPILLLPANGSWASPTPLFDWYDVTGHDPTMTFTLEVGVGGTAGPAGTIGSPIWEASLLTASEYATPPTSVLTEGGPYFWRVGAISPTPEWSEVWQFSVDATPPPVPTLDPSLDGAVLPSPTLTIAWPPVTDVSAVTYRLRISTDPSFAEAFVVVDDLSPSATWTGTLPADGTYYVRIESTNEAGLWSVPAEASFAIDTTPPGAITLLAPPAGSLLAEPQPVFDWSDSENAGNTSYNWQLSPNPAFSVFSAELVGLDSSDATAPSPLADGTYWWRACAVDAAGNAGPWSPPWSFTKVGNTGPPGTGPITIVGDFNGNGVTSDPTPTLVWAPDPDAAAYLVAVFDADGNPVPGAGGANPTNTFTVPVGLSTGDYLVAVLPVDDFGNPVGAPLQSSISIDPAEVELPPATEPITIVGDFNGNGVTSDPTPTLAWDPVPGAEAYDVTIFDANGNPVAGGTSPVPNWTVPVDLPDGSYTVVVQPIDDTGDPVGDPIQGTFVVDAGEIEPPPIYGSPALIAPLSGAILDQLQVTLEWAAPSGFATIDHYLVEMDQGATLADPIWWSATATTTLAQTPVLDNFETYTWRVRAVDPLDNAGPWSATWTFSTQVTPTTGPTAPMLQAPSDGALLAGPAVTLVWTGSLDAAANPAVSYAVELFNGAGGLAWSHTTSSLDATTPPLSDGTYSWRVQATDAWGLQSAWSEVWVFEVEAYVPPDLTPPPAPALVRPADGAQVEPPGVVLEWAAVEDPSGVLYTVELNWEGAPIEVRNLAETVAAFGSLAEGEYTWRVRATDGAANAGPWSPAWRFQLKAPPSPIPPGPPILLAPQDGEVLPEGNVMLEWLAPPDAVDIALFEVHISDNAAFGDPLLHQFRPVTESVTVPFDAGRYWWRVRAIDRTANEGEWSDVWTFEVVGAAPPPQPPPSSGSAHRRAKKFCAIRMAAAGHPMPTSLPVALLLLGGVIALGGRCGRRLAGRVE